MRGRRCNSTLSVKCNDGTGSSPVYRQRYCYLDNIWKRIRWSMGTWSSSFFRDCKQDRILEWNSLNT